MPRKKKEVEPNTIELAAETTLDANTIASATIDSPVNFKAQFEKMYKITDQIVSKILSNGGSLEQDSYVVREEFGEALAAGYRFLRNQQSTSNKLRKAGHDNEEVDYELDMYKEISDVFMMSTSYARHHDWTFSNRTFDIIRPNTITDIQTYLSRCSEVLFRINTDSINEGYLYEFMEDTVTMINQYDSHLSVLDAKIDKLYSKIFKEIQ